MAVREHRWLLEPGSKRDTMLLELEIGTEIMKFGHKHIDLCKAFWRT